MFHAAAMGSDDFTALKEEEFNNFLQHIKTFVPASASSSPVTTANVQAQCLTVSVPMSWDPTAPDCLYKQTIDIFVKRIFMGNPDSSSTNQVWWFPGGAGVVCFPFLSSSLLFLIVRTFSFVLVVLLSVLLLVCIS
jgi:hypothetical protein